MSALPMPERDLAIGLPAQPLSPTRTRTPLAMVAPRASKRRKAPFVLLCLVLVVGVVASVLAMNVSVAQTQYQLVEMRNHEKDLTQSNEAMTAELDNKKAPQNLAAAAAKLSMVPAGQPGTVDLGSGKVTGKADAAAKPEKQDKPQLSQPLTPAEQSALNAKKQAAAQKSTSPAAENTTAKAGAAAGADAADAATGDGAAEGTTAQAAEAAKKAAERGAGTDAAASGTTTPRNPTFSKKELGGGTIPAPRSN
ncbi:hypothetical protein [Galactobacter caseinivorans]|uniref:Cell division protein FtsL n=1 Tax=Galactobacter caseinivorans TaxID=2676123 RepID=A0A496PM82_9MICC|nr:hypothetical protein [Galactobacter caseinivorans]RKW71658.1 hypothetical protein DWQ67_02140 [Galactobacter caseinivorans]